MESKPHMVPITDGTFDAIRFDFSSLELPHIVKLKDGSLWADADELRKWRALSSGTDPSGKDAGQSEAGLQ